MNTYQALFTPFTLNNGVTVPNRLAVAPMTHYASNADGTISDEEQAFLAGRADDFGLFITASTLVHPSGHTFKGQPFAFDDSHLPSLTETAHILKQGGAKAILQLHHGGALAQWADEPLAPSAIGKARQMSESEIWQVIDGFGKASELAILAGFDGVEIHGANGHLIQQFVSQQSNGRDDAWGGNLADRMRLSVEIINKIDEIKTKHDKTDFIVGYRLSPEEAGDNGLTMSDTLAVIDTLLGLNLQYLSVSQGDFYANARRGAGVLPRLQVIREHIGNKLALIGVGGLVNADDLMNAYRTGWADFLAVGKAVLINPDFATLIKSGRADEIHTTFDMRRIDEYRLPKGIFEN
ncbi:2,4-dienoyl-CoA reductase-like NADH-dependent reductase (Old Yellow Enzyme family) [Neisseria sp. HSC-16F19]|nr:NADH-dependent flavin oxidoreductase [Neisseria sp. HSC-16F19]MCP2041577.1 2,4-dienoyl-CoA reductase-like NADH-dependent reductase (Old Yellow Enzyme family) [Neisseria sp. HSC-16F19]